MSSPIEDQHGKDSGAALPVPGSDLAEQEARRARQQLWLKLGCLLLVVMAALHSSNRSIGGGDTWVAMANGRYTMGPWPRQDPGRTWQMKALDLFGIHMTKVDHMGARTRPFNPVSNSFSGLMQRVAFHLRHLGQPVTTADMPAELADEGWTNQNWLTHVAFYNMRAWWGENSIVFYKFAQSVLTALLAYWAARRLGAHPVLAAAAISFGMLLSRSFIDLRPNQSTILCAVAMLLVLVYWRAGHNRALWWLVPIMVFWANVHGGFIYAMMMMAVAVGGYAVHRYLGRYAYFVVLAGLALGIALLIRGLIGWHGEISRLHAEGLTAAARQREAVYGSWQKAGMLAVVVLAVLAGLYAWRGWRWTQDSFPEIGRQGLRWLVVGFIGVLMIPAVFSPFGLENAIHPLIVAAGEEGEIWRQVVEWRPIWDKQGFGNANPYIFFLWFFAAAFALWWVLWIFRPQTSAPSPIRATPDSRPRRSRHGPDQRHTAPVAPAAVPWPRIDVAHIGIIAITLIMSIMSRRFIFLGGLILAPFLAQMAQEIIQMLLQLRQRDRLLAADVFAGLGCAALGFLTAWALRDRWFAFTAMPGWVQILLAAGCGLVVAGGLWLAWRPPCAQRIMHAGTTGLTYLAAGLTGLVFVWCMWDTYYRPPVDGMELSVFRRMVGIPAQPVEAIKFFEANQLEGVVLNEWVNGGFITFWQPLQPDSGRTRCQVHMDGRAQAAYSVEHFQRWNALKVGLVARPQAAVQRAVVQLARQHDIPQTAPQLYDRLWTQAERDDSLRRSLFDYVQGDPALAGALQRHRVRQLAAALGLPTADDDFHPRLLELFVDELGSYIDFPHPAEFAKEGATLETFQANQRTAVATIAQRMGRDPRSPDVLEQMCTPVGRYRLLAVLAAGDPRLYDAFLQREGVNVALLDTRRSASDNVFQLLMDHPAWRLMYLDHMNAVFVRGHEHYNRRLLADPFNNAVYQSADVRKFSQGYALCQQPDRDAQARGFEMLLDASFHHYPRDAYDAIYRTGLRLDRRDDVFEYFRAEFEQFRARIDAGERFGRSDHFARLLHSVSVLASMARDPGQREHYSDLRREYEAHHESFMRETREGVFW